MLNDLNNKTVILTGAGGGIGKAVAEKLANEKMNLILLGGNNIAKLEKEIARLEKMARNEKQPKKKFELVQKIKELQTRG